MSYSFGNCYLKVNKKHVLEENKRKFIINVKDLNDLLIVNVDNCLFKNSKNFASEIRCDNLVIKQSTHEAYFVELKGCDFDHALEQLKNSIKIIDEPSNGFINQKFKKKFAYIVLSRTPSILPQNKIASFRAKKIDLRSANNEIEISI